MFRTDKYACAAALVACALAPKLAAKKPALFPDFSLTALDGKSVKSNQLHLPNRWLLIYVSANSAHSDTVLNVLKEERPSSLGQIIVVVGGVPVNDVRTMAQQYPHLASVTWYADTKKLAFKAMELVAIPVVLGVKEDTVQWSLTGTLANPDRLKSILKTWKDKDK
jgi:hypothetical protein